MIKVLHVITGLRRGGAEGALAQLCLKSDRSRFRHSVAVLRDGGVWGETLRAGGIAVEALRLNRLADAPGALGRLEQLIASERPDVVQSWLYHADLLATLALPKHNVPRLIWTLRNSDLAASRRASWGLIVVSLAALSRRPDIVVSNSKAGLGAHLARGYHPKRTLVIPNGVDLARFAPAHDQQAALRGKIGLPRDVFLIGMAARREGFKDHATFIEAARLAVVRGYDGAFVLVGEGVAGDVTIKTAIDVADLTRRFRVLPAQDDMPRLYNALDLVTLSSSHGEGFPNVLAEAMACARPVVATDAGDARTLVGDAGLIVASRSPTELASAWLKVAAMTGQGRDALGLRGRARIEQNFSLETAIASYETLYAELAR